MNVQEKIKERAYALYLERGSKPGHALEDWARAEKEIMEQSSAHNSEKTGSQQAQTGAKTFEQPRQEPAAKQESKQPKKNSKPQDAFLFSSNKQNVRSLLK